MFGNFTNKISQFLLNKAKNQKKEEINDFIDDLFKELNTILINEDVHPILINLILNEGKQYIQNNKNQLLDSKNLIKNLLKNILSEYIMEDENFPWKKFIILVGDNGNGKTTVASKLAHFWSLQNMKIAVMHHDPFRYGSRKQLEENLEGTNIKIITKEDDTTEYDRVIIDTAGFQSWTEDYKSSLNFDGNYIYVGSCLIGNSSYYTIENIQKILNLDGIIITNCDGEARSGLFLSASYLIKKPILFISDNETIKYDGYNPTIIPFQKDSLLKRLLGLYDETGFQDAVDKISKKQNKLMDKILTGIFDYETMEEILEGMVYNKFNALLGSMGNMQMNNPQQKIMMKKMLLIIQSMTHKEKVDLSLLDGKDKYSRIQRIAKGTNMDPNMVLMLLQNLKTMMGTFKNFSSYGMEKFNNMENIDDIKDQFTNPEFLKEYIPKENNENIINHENKYYNNNMSVPTDNNNENNNMQNPFGNQKDGIKMLKNMFPQPEQLYNFIKSLPPEMLKTMPGMAGQDTSMLQQITLEHIIMMYNMDAE